MRDPKVSWKLMLMPREPTWWVWLVTAALLGIGLAGYPKGFLAAIGLTIAQTVFFILSERSLRSSPVQTRLAYTALLLICFVPGLRWLYWLPAVGTLALVVCGYCLMARFLSLLPWNRSERITPALLRHTFLSPPALETMPGDVAQKGCPGGLCSIEAQLGARYRPHPATSAIQGIT
jgi:hypothetical protein